MSPHNYARFNGSNINGKHSYHSNQNALALAFGDMISYIYRGLFKYSGLDVFFNSRLFKRGIADDQLTFFSK